MKNFWNQLPRPFFVLAPMEQVTDVVFRQVVARAGAPDVWYTEFANATGWVHAGERGIGGRLVKTANEHPIVAQIWGGEPGDLEQFAKHCASLGFDGIDINMGCPAKSAVKSGGAALIRQPDLAAAAIAAAKTSGLPISVKTRLGYSSVSEWRDWLTRLLQQNITTLTIHLRTKKEMSKVPAHWELIPEIVALRDQIAPQTLLVINGDIKNKQQGMELAKQYGVDGVMIGRGIFIDPFAFSQQLSPLASLPPVAERSSATPRAELALFPPSRMSSPNGADGVSDSAETGLAIPLVPNSRVASPLPLKRVTGGGAAPALSSAEGDVKEGADRPAGENRHDGGSQGDVTSEAMLRVANSRAGGTSDADSDLRATKGGNDGSGDIDRKAALIDLLHYHLNTYDEYADQTHRPYDTLKRFFKIYIRDFDGASDLRDQLMHTKSTGEARAVLAQITN